MSYPLIRMLITDVSPLPPNPSSFLVLLRLRLRHFHSSCVARLHRHRAAAIQTVRYGRRETTGTFVGSRQFTLAFGFEIRTLLAPHEPFAPSRLENIVNNPPSVCTPVARYRRFHYLFYCLTHFFRLSVGFSANLSSHFCRELRQWCGSAAVSVVALFPLFHPKHVRDPPTRTCRRLAEKQISYVAQFLYFVSRSFVRAFLTFFFEFFSSRASFCSVPTAVFQAVIFAILSNFCMLNLFFQSPLRINFDFHHMCAF